jgi:very-short-patch-repair endonuclease
VGEPDPVNVVKRLGGSAQAGDILARCTRRSLAFAVRNARLVRAARGVYVLPGLHEALKTAARLRGVVSHASAARLTGLDLVNEPKTLHVSVPHGAHREQLDGVTLHRTRNLPPGDVEQGLTAPMRTVLDCAATMPFSEALAIADSALSLSYVRPERLREAALATKGPGRSARIKVAMSADRRAHSVFESVLRAVLLDAGFTSLVPQLEIWLGRRLIRADLGDRQLMIAIEADSFEFHGTREALERDCERYDALTAAGWTVLRFAYRQVMRQPDWVVDTVRATYEIARRGRGRRAG